MEPSRTFPKAIIPILLLIILCSSQAAMAKPYKIKAVSAWPQTVFEVQNFTQFLNMLKARVAQEYPGELIVDYMGGPEVIPGREQVEALRNHVVDMVFTTDGYYISALPEVNALSLTQIRPWEERSRGVNALLNQGHMERLNAVYLGRMGSGIPFTLYLTRPVASADLSGLNIRCSPTHINFLKALGAKPLVIPPPDVYTALERGLADGFIWPAGLISDWGWDEVTKYVVDTPFYMAVNVVLMNKKSWEKLPPHLQTLIQKVQESAEHLAVERGTQRVKTEFDAFKKAGIQFINLPANEASRLTRTAYETLWKTVISKAPENGPRLKAMVSKQGN